VTFSCYRRRRLLDHNQAKQIVIHFLGEQLRNQAGQCVGFVIMPDHVHAIVHFKKEGLLSVFMNQWKRRSSIQLKRFYRIHLENYYSKLHVKDAMWQPKYYAFNIFSEAKLNEKLAYMHNNPVQAGLVNDAKEWQFGSARHYLLGQSVGAPITAPG